MSEFIMMNFLRVHVNITLHSMVTISTFNLIKQNYEADLGSVYIA